MKKIHSYYNMRALIPPYEKKTIPIIGIIIFALISTVTISAISSISEKDTNIKTHASSFGNFIEPENQSISGNVALINDANASGGKYIVLGLLGTPRYQTPTPTGVGQNNSCRNAWEWPCSADSVWNQPITSGAIYSSSSDPRVVSLNIHNKINLNTTSWGVAIYKGETSDPEITLLPSSSYGTYQWDGQTIIVKGKLGMQLPAASGKEYDLDDGFINIVQPDGHTDIETTFAEKPASDAAIIKTGPIHKWDIASSCRSENKFNGGYMAGVTMAGVIRSWEMSGTNEVRHSLLLGICTDQLKKGYIWPATYEDGFSNQYSGTIPMGTIFAIPPTVNIESLGLNQYGKKIGYALQRYGAIVDLQGCGPIMVGEPSLEANGIAASIRADLPKLLTQMVVLTNASQLTPKGQGTSQIPSAPGFCIQ